MKKKTLKKTKRKKGRSKKLYFGKEAHEAIVKYQSTSCRKEKHKIYEESIKVSFHKLVENLIFIHGFVKRPENFNSVKSDCVSFLYETLEKFDPARGSKAFSYFNVCAKNFLIIRANKRKKISQRNISIENFKNLSAAEKNAIEMYNFIPSQEDMMIRAEDKERLFVMLDKISEKASNENEKLCISAVITLFKNIDDLEFLNKRAIFVYLREISGLTPKQLSVSMSNLRKHYRDLVKQDDNFVLFLS